MFLKIETTKYCNQSCKHCSFSRLYSSNETHLTLNQLKTKITELNPTNKLQVLLTGGEPLLNPQIFDMISYLKSIGADYISLATNGIPLIQNNELKLKLKNSGINELIISLSGSSNEYLLTRGIDAQSQLINELDFFKNSSISITGNFLIHQKNKEKLSSSFLKIQSQKSIFNLIRFLPYAKDYDVSPNPILKEIDETEMKTLSNLINKHNRFNLLNKLKRLLSLASKIEVVLIKPSKEENDIIFLSA